MERKLGDWYDSFLKLMEKTEPPLMYVKWVAISTMASVLQRKVFLEWDEPVFPNMYIVLVGPPGARKGSAMRPGRFLIREVEGINMAANCTSDRALIDNLSRAGHESIGNEGEQVYHSSLSILSTEASVLFTKANERLTEFLTDLYDCLEYWKYDTRHEGSPVIKNAFINILGATTPRKLNDSEIFGAIGGGLTSRMIFAYAEKKRQTIVFPWRLEEEKELFTNLYNDLLSMALLVGQYKIDDSFIEFYADWYPKQDANPPFDDEKLEGYCNRRAKHLLKLCIIFSASRGNSMTITSEDAERAVEILEETEEFLPVVFSATGRNENLAILHKILSDLAVEKKVKRSDILKRYYTEIDDEDLKRIIATLVGMNRIEIDLLQGGDLMLTWIEP